MTVKVYSKEQCAQWLVSNGYDDFPLDQCPKWLDGIELPNLKHSMCFVIDSYSVSAENFILLAQVLSRWQEGNDALFLFSDFDTIWSRGWSADDEDRPIMPEPFAEYRRHRHAENRHLIEAPGYYWNADDEADQWTMCEIFHYVMAFNWQGYALPAHRKSIVWLADEVVEARTDDKEKIQHLRKMVDLFGLDVFRENGKTVPDQLRPNKRSATALT